MLYSSNNDICKGPPSANAVKADARYAVILSSSAGAISASMRAVRLGQTGYRYFSRCPTVKCFRASAWWR